MQREAEILFHKLVDLSPAQRESYFLERQVPADLRAEVEELLRFDSGADHVLTESVAGAAEQALQMNGAVEEDARCGPYLLGRVLGRGGMGSVYLAERADGEVEQRVAIKLLRYGGDEPDFRDRFLRERQILAKLSHPGIARLLDAGHKDDGQPYLVMDYIDGTPIDVYAEKLDPRGKAALFVQVCDAVSYAHRNLIVHRDLKPSNILVDRSGQPKLLDFGIAKILDASQDQTRTRERLLTPDYASPEQVRGGAQTTAADVYSLGAVLYKLLTGRSPHAPASEAQEDVEAAICFREPVPPSRLNPAVPKDLDFVVGKALRKEPDERYPSVDTFADDLRALLEWRPVRARSGNAWYRTRKFVRRYRLPVAAVALTLAGLAAGLYVANRERVIAQRRFLQVRQLANKFIDLDAEIRGLPGSTKARNRIVSESLEYLTALGAEAGGDKELALEIGNAYLQVARVQGVPTLPNLGQLAQAEESLRRADLFVDTVLAARPGNRRALVTSAEIAHDWMVVADHQYRNDDALKHAGKAAAQLDRLTRGGSLDPDEINTVTHIYANLAVAYSNSDRLEDTVRYAQRAIDISQSVESARMRRASAFGVLAIALWQLGHLEEALPAIRASRDALATFGGAEPSQRLNLLNAFQREGRILGLEADVSLNRPAEALVSFQQSMDIAEDLAKKDPNDQRSRYSVASLGQEMGEILSHTDARRALAVYDHALARIREAKTNARAQRMEAELLASSSYAARSVYGEEDAKQRIDTAFRLLEQTKGYDRDKLERNVPLQALADHYAKTGQAEKAVEAYQKLEKGLLASNPDAHKYLRAAAYISRDWIVLAGLLRRLGRAEEATAIETRNLALWRSWDIKLPKNEFVLRQIAAAPPR